MSEDDLEQAVRAHDHARDLQQRLAAAHDRLARSRSEAERAARAAGEEAADVERLRGLTWTSVAAGLRGRRDNDLAREEAELAAARVEAGRAARRIEHEREEVERLARELDVAGAERPGHDAVLAARQAWAREHDPVHGPRLGEVAEESAHLAAEERRLGEVLVELGHAEQWLALGLASTGRAVASSGAGGGSFFLPWREQHAAMDEAVTQLEHAAGWVRRTGLAVPELDEALRQVTFSDGDKVKDVLVQGPSEIFGHPRLRRGEQLCHQARAHLAHHAQAVRADLHALGARRETLADERVRLLSGRA